MALLLFIMAPTAAAAPAVSCTLQGRITDTAGQPLTGAIIELPDLHTGASSDADGQYRIQDLPQGNYLVTVRLLSFSAQTRRVQLQAVTEYNVTLSETVIEQQEVIVTGSSHATEQRRSPTPVQSLSLKALQENASTNIIDAVTRMPGVSQVTTGPAISKPVIRGLGYNRIITLSDGIRQEGQQWGDEHGIEIDDYNVASVEVLKGPASLSYGSDGLAGVINIRSAEPLPAGSIRGKVSANYQTNNGLAALHAQLAGNQQGISWQAYMTGKAAHDYRNAYDGAVFNTRFSNMDYGASIGISRHWGASRFVFSSFDQHLGIAEGGRDSLTGRFVKEVNNNGVAGIMMADAADGRNYSRQSPRQHILHQKLAWINNRYLSNGGHIDLTLGAQQNLRREYEDVTAPDQPALFLQLRTFTYDARYVFPAVKDWQLSTGVNGMLQYNRNKGSEFLVPDYNLFDIGGYLIARKELGAWTVSGGLRLDARSLKAANLYLDSTGGRAPAETGNDALFRAFDRRFTSPSGSLGASYAVSRAVTLKANLSSGYRAPNIAELAANGVHEGTIRYEYGNTALRAENSFQADLGAEYSTEHLFVQAAVFYNYIHNYIFLRKLQDVSGADSIPVQYNEDGYAAYGYTQTAARLFGGELYADFHPHPLDWLHIENTVSWVQGRSSEATDSTRYLPGIPAARWLLALRVQRKALGKQLRNAYIKLELDNYAAQDRVYAAYGTETASPAYTLLNASLGFDVQRHNRTLCSVAISGQNLTDKAYQNHLSRLRYADVNYATGRTGIWNIGRNFSILVSVPLQLK